MKKALNSLFAPSLTPEQAQAAATEAADALVAASAAVDQAQATLEAAHLNGNPEQITQAEAALVAAKAQRDRAGERHKAFQRRVELAKTDRQAEQRAEGVKRLRAACKERLEAAAQIDAAYAQLAAAVERMQAADAIVAELHRIASSSAALGSNYGAIRLYALMAYAAAKRGLPNAALPGRTRDDIPTTVAAVEHDNATILLGLDR